MALSTQSLWGTNVSLTTPYWQCGTGCYLGNIAPTLHPATVGRELTSTPSPPTVSEMPAPPTRTKWQCHSSNQEATMPRPEGEEAMGLDITPKEQPHQRQKEGESSGEPPQEEPLGSFRKDSKLIHVTMQAYFKMHHPNYDHECPMTSSTPSRKWLPPLAL